MPTRADRPDTLVDTSAAVALVLADHVHHEVTLRALGTRTLGLAGHAAFETFSVLTRLPPPARRTPAAVARLMAVNFPATRHLSAGGAAAVVERLVANAIGGGSVYDALVAAAAVEHEVGLATRDRGALDTYRAFGVDVELLPDA